MSNKMLGGLFIVILIFLGGIFFLVSKQRSSSLREQNTIITISPSLTISSLKETTIELTKSGFSPHTVTIKKDEGIIWMNRSGTKASINSSDHATHKKYPEVNLGEFAAGMSINHVFIKPGKYEYHNHYKPLETGTIIVE